MTSYVCDIHNDNDADAFTQIIQVGSRVLTFQFQWATTSEEQFALVKRYLKNKASNDPLIVSGGFNRTYDWFEYYENLIGKDIDKWLDSKPILPVSLSQQNRTVQKQLVNIYIAEAQSLEPVIRLYKDVIKWQFTMTSQGIDTAVGYVQPGGWYHNQDNALSFRFVAEIDNIGRDTISEVSLQFEVYDE